MERSDEPARHSLICSNLPVGNFTLKEWSMPALLGAIGYPVGAFGSGNPSPAFARLGGNVVRPTALMAASLGAAAGFLLSYQSSWARFVLDRPAFATLDSHAPLPHARALHSLYRLTGYSNDA